MASRYPSVVVWLGATLLILLALLLSRWTVGEDRVGLALTLGSMVLSAAWFGTALWSGTGVRFLPASRDDWWVVLALAAACSLAFVVGAAVFLRLGILEDELATLAGRAETTSVWVTWLVALVAGCAEEFVFRGTVYAWVERWWPVVTSTLIYAAAMAVTGQLALVMAAGGLGLAAALARHTSRSLAGPIVVHAVWSTTMVHVLPLLT